MTVDYRTGDVRDVMATIPDGSVSLVAHLDPRNAELVDARREEVRRSLNPTHVAQVDGQLDIFAEGAA